MKHPVSLTRAEVRTAFLESIEDGQPDKVLAGECLNCMDIVPSRCCDELAIAPGATFARAAREVLAE